MVVMLVLLLTADSVNSLIGYLTFCIYRSPLDIDLWTGALTETPMDGSDVGPTLNCRLSERFNRLSDFFVFTDVHWILIYGQVLLLRHPWMVVMLVLLLTADSVNGLIGYLTFLYLQMSTGY